MGTISDIAGAYSSDAVGSVAGSPTDFKLDLGDAFKPLIQKSEVATANQAKKDEAINNVIGGVGNMGKALMQTHLSPQPQAALPQVNIGAGGNFVPSAPPVGNIPLPQLAPNAFSPPPLAISDRTAKSSILPAEGDLDRILNNVYQRFCKRI